MPLCGLDLLGRVPGASLPKGRRRGASPCHLEDMSTKTCLLEDMSTSK
jgi:hypothetical protein